MIAKAIRALYYILFFIVPLIVIPSTSELFELNKMLVIYVVALMVFCFGALDTVIHEKTIFRRTPLDIPLGIFMGVMVLSMLFSIDRHTSFFGYYGRFNGGVLSIAAFIVLYYGAAWYLPWKHVLNIMRVSVVTSCLVMIWGLSGKIGYDFSCLLFTGQLNNSCWTDQFRPSERMFSTLGQPNWLGAYLAASFFIAAYLYVRQPFKERSPWVAHIPYGAYLVVNFMCLLFTRSRSAFIAWCVGGALFALYYGARRRQTILKPFASIAVCCVIAILIFKTGIEKVDRFITPPKPPQKSAPAQSAPAPTLSSEVTESFDIRKIVWQGAWDLGLRYPILGTGPETFAYAYYFTRPAEHNMTSEWDFIYNKAHNEYLNYLATTGFTGLAAYLGVIGMVGFVFIKNMKQRSKKDKQGINGPDLELLSVAFASSYLVLLITNGFGFSTSTSQLYFFLLPAFVVAAAHNRAAAHSAERPRLTPRHYAQLASIGVFATASLVWIVLFFSADLQYSLGVARSGQGEYQQAATHFSNALTFHKEHVYEDRLSTTLANISLLAAYGDKPETASKFITLSRYYIDDAIRQSPKNMLYWKTKGKNEYTFYQVNPEQAYIDEAIKALDQAYTLAPTEPKLPYTLGLLYGATNQKEVALKYLDTTISLKRDYIDAYILKLKLLMAWKEDDQVQKMRSQILTTFPGITEQQLDEELK